MSRFRERRALVTALCLVLLFGAFLRIYPTTTIRALGIDEKSYAFGLKALTEGGLTAYPSMMRDYVRVQPTLSFAVIPPTRITFMAGAFLWNKLFGTGLLQSLRDIACLASILGLVVAATFLWRAVGLASALGAVALLACAPMQIQLAQRIYIDGVFAFTAVLSLWLLWENLRAPNSTFWLVSYIISLIVMIMTKENAAFVFVGILCILSLNRWLKMGTVTSKLVLATAAGALIGVIGLIVAAGGITTLVQVFQANLTKAYSTGYVIRTGDGPWFRYLLDLIAMSPLAAILALGALARWHFPELVSRFLAVFLIASYALMANLRYGMSLRYTAMWDLPIRWLAFTQILAIALALPARYRSLFASLAVALVCAIDLHQYFFFFAQNGTYDPTSESILRQLNIVK